MLYVYRNIMAKLNEKAPNQQKTMKKTEKNLMFKMRLVPQGRTKAYSRVFQRCCSRR